ncbi:MAG TPA: iron-containing alcohol dehydrogenase [Deltaproteobacteria bacterium]|nr:iron-containing alcohol dehydrogenase [Deltaproteobacteria bacterium]HPR55418.1 iron-containing alcohol dehydrogenase [Deltaproteobacteria bacterium]HXK48142.1 iron-containing alcohol dehydrogenase [Deltaproteobacteria bacterium]
MRFEFATAGRIVFGQGSTSEVVDAAPSLGSRCLLVTGKNPHRWTSLMDRLRNRGVASEVYRVPGEPTTETVLKGISAAREHRCDCVIAIGGGSVIDTGKAIAAMITNPGDLLDYLEVVGRGMPLQHHPVPYIAVPTTAGTGSEVTRNAVIISREHGVKASLRSPLLLPALVVVDPLLTHSLPPEITASTGLDALTQLLESYVSSGANPLTDGICREGLARAARSIRTAYQDGGNTTAREDMALASLFSGIALANAKLGAVHGFAAAAGGQCRAPHGLVCACLLPHVEEMNLRALRTRSPGSPAVRRFEEVARIMTGNPEARADDGITWLRELCSHMKVPPLSEIGIEEDVYPELISGARRASSMKGNPIVLTDEELDEILHRA